MVFRKSKTNAVYFLVIAVSLVLSLTLSSCSPQETVVSGVEVLDGDTLRVSGQSFRIVGIDAPEIHEGDKPVGEYGQDAKYYLYWFASNFELSYEQKGKDSYGRILVYLFGKDRQTGAKYLYEASLAENGYARPLIYDSTSVSNYTKAIVDAYKRAYENKRGIFSKYDNTPVIDKTKASQLSSYKGKIVWLEMDVNNVIFSNDTYYIYSDFALVKIRSGEYNNLFNGYNLYGLKGRKVRFYGELWYDSYEGKYMIMLRAPFEIKILN